MTRYPPARMAAAAPRNSAGPIWQRGRGAFYTAANGDYNFGTLESLTGASFEWFHRFISFDSVAAQHTQFTAAANAGKRLYVSWRPNKTVGTSYATLLAGGYNAKIDEWLDYLGSLKTEVVIRFAWEMNGHFDPTSPLYTGGADRAVVTDAAQWAAGWRYVVSRARARGSKARWFWCPNQVDTGPAGNPIALEQFWPGKEYVDIVGYDSYNGLNGLWMTPEQTFRGKTNTAQADAYDRVTALHPTADVWVGETGCVDLNDALDTGSLAVGHDKGAWYRDAFALTTLPRLTAVHWFTAPGTRDWRPDSSPAALEGFRDGLAGLSAGLVDAGATLQNLRAVNFDALLATNAGTSFTPGVINLAKLTVGQDGPVSGIVHALGVAGAGLTAGQNLAGIYDASGNRVAITGDLGTLWTGTAGVTAGKVAPLTAPVLLTAGTYYLAFLSNGTTGASLVRAGAGSPFATNPGSSGYRWSTWGSAQTTLPPTIPLASAAAAGAPFWVGLS